MHFYFFSEYDSVHQLSIGSICPGETVIACLDDPDEQEMSYTNDGSESVTAFFMVDAYSDAAGAFTLQWQLTVTCSVSTTTLTGEVCDCSGNMCTDAEFCYDGQCNTNEKGNNNIEIKCFFFGSQYKNI